MYVCTDCVSGVCMCVSGEYMYNGGRAVNICTVYASGECMCMSGEYMYNGVRAVNIGTVYASGECMCRCASGECVYKRMRAG